MLGWEAFGLAQLHFPNDSDSPGEHSAVYFIPRVEASWWSFWSRWMFWVLWSNELTQETRAQGSNEGGDSSNSFRTFRTFRTFCSILSDLLEAGATRRVKNSNLRMEIPPQTKNEKRKTPRFPFSRHRRPATGEPLAGHFQTPPTFEQWPEADLFCTASSHFQPTFCPFFVPFFTCRLFEGLSLIEKIGSPKGKRTITRGNWKVEQK